METFKLIFATLRLIVLMGQISTISILGSKPSEQIENDGFCYGESFVPTWKPLHYDLRFDVNPQMSYFSGVASINGIITVNETLEIKLHGVNLTISEVLINGTDVGWNYDESAAAIIIQPPSTLMRNEKLDISIKYDGIFQENDGLMIMNDTQSRPIIFSSLEPISARRLFPCVDIPSFKATFKVHIKTEVQKYVVLSNMPVDDFQEPDWISFQTTPIMATYLVAFVICDYSPVILNADKNVTLWVPNERIVDTKMAVAVTTPLINSLEEYLQSTLTLPKVDIYTVPIKTNVGGMENWGLIMLQENSILYNENESKAADEETILATITHEFSHNWFGNLLTTESWCDLWLLEAIPTFLHGKISQQVFNTSCMDTYVKRMSIFSVMDGEFVFTSKPLQMAKGEVPDENEIFSFSMYYKGASVLSMLESVVTPLVFQTALQTLIRKYQYKLASSTKFWDEVQIAVDKYNSSMLPAKVEDIMLNWTIYEGHPVVHILRDLSTGEVLFTQEPCQMQKKAKHVRYWWIPLSYTTSTEYSFENSKPITWLPPTNEAYKLNMTLNRDQWIIFNVRSTGYYRVNYDLHTWHLLINQLRKNHSVIHYVNRGSLIDDSFKMAMSSDIDFAITLELMTYLHEERNSFPWTSVNENCRLIYGSINGRAKVMFKTFIQTLLKKVFNELITHKSDNHEMRTMRQDVFNLAALVDLPELDSYSKELALKIARGQQTENDVPAEIREIVWCAAVKSGTPDIFNYVYDRFTKEKDIVKKERILLRQLDCSTNRTDILFEEYLRWAPNEISAFVSSHWLEECEEIIKKLSADELKKIVEGANIQTEKNNSCVKKLEAIVNKDIIETDKEESSSIKRIKNEMLNWLTVNLPFYVDVVSKAIES